MITFANKLYPDQSWQYIWPDLDPICLTIYWCSWITFFKKNNFETKKLSRGHRSIKKQHEHIKQLVLCCGRLVCVLCLILATPVKCILAPTPEVWADSALRWWFVCFWSVVYCCSHSLRGFVFEPPWVIKSLLKLMRLQSSCWGRGSWLLYFICLPDVLLLLVFCVFSKRCHGLVCIVWLWYFLAILSYFLH